MTKEKLNLSIEPLKKLAITPEEEKEMIIRCRANDEEARALLIRTYFPYVAGLAKRYHVYFPRVAFDELVEEGNFGLLQAMDHYDTGKLARFSSYAWYWIINAIQDYISKQVVFLKVPPSVLKNLRKIAKLTEEAVSANREISLAEITERLDIEMDEVKDLLAHRANAATPLSLDQSIDRDDQRQTLKDVLPENEASFESILEEIESKEDLDELITKLSDEEARVIRLRFGFEEDCYHTLTDVAKKLAITTQKVKDVEEIALSKLKNMLMEKDS